MSSEWLQNLKADDSVMYRVTGYSRDTLSMLTVVRTTKTLVICSNGARFNRSSGRLSGENSWSASYIEPVTPENTLELRLKRLRDAVRAKIERVNYKYLGSVSEERLLEIHECFKDV